MNRTGTIVVIAIAILVVAGGLLFATHNSTAPASSSTSPATNSNATTSPSSAASSSPSAAATAADVTLHYTASGFSPASVTVPAGHKLIVKNDSSATIQVDSDPHPQHTDNPQLNIGTISPGASSSVTLTRTGTWGIHNHLDPAVRGTVVVQ
jgi:plastocyanin